MVTLSAVAAACGGTPTGPDGPPAPRIARTRFLAFGDSITVGEVTNPLSVTDSPSSIVKMIAVPAASYPTQLQTQLRSRYTAQASDITVVNSGVAGERLTEGIVRFEDALNAARPEVVLLMEGVNDLRSLGPDISTDILAFMAQQAQSRDARVFLGSMLPTVAGRQRSQPVSELVLLNGKLQAMAVQRGLVYVDLYTTLLPEAEAIIGADGLHPTEAGYRRIADVFFAAIRSSLEVR